MWIEFSERRAMDDRAKDNPTVFVVDDDADVREGLRALLQSVGLECRVFDSTKHFLQEAPPAMVSCLVLDVRLPGANGLDFQAELTKAHVDIPIIFMTGHGDIPMSVRAMKAGAVEFLTKPLHEQGLLDAIHVALARDRVRREQDDKLRALRARFDSLSDREREVLSHVTVGMLNKQIAAEMGLSEVTVKVHRHNLIKKLSAKSLPDLVRMADILKMDRQSNGRS
jgi:RNA polymerase sigma factor (sigma-70 family)